MPQTFFNMDITHILSTLIKAYFMYTDPNDYSDKFICILYDDEHRHFVGGIWPAGMVILSFFFGGGAGGGGVATFHPSNPLHGTLP